MRFSSAIVLVVVAALTPSISAGDNECASWCIHNRQCHTCPIIQECVFPWCAERK
ncbi:hypothetical protein CY34DRAFT_805068 [Suillus luteus UH-Slu-Lm8-n1]|uniref:Uncharacterized protein n=1 Tax=Suillus luteus UH-Slu-Lm8-n1 TaxID=930992 RepID=A0A0D0BGF3_9AGAM|nr:hypothetical protein CY34DRAFT_805068 [Suillus luteus UH-Slu-Lm8-n1]